MVYKNKRKVLNEIERAVKLLYVNGHKTKDWKKNRKNIQEFVGNYLQRHDFKPEKIITEIRKDGVEIHIHDLKRVSRPTLFNQLTKAIFASTT
ncbi:MAG: hypothetical protein ACTSRW_06905 [Candidatus Helarchaeota archaeon]